MCRSSLGRACGTRLFTLHPPGDVAEELPIGAAGVGQQHHALDLAGEPLGFAQSKPSCVSHGGNGNWKYL